MVRFVYVRNLSAGERRSAENCFLIVLVVDSSISSPSENREQPNDQEDDSEIPASTAQRTWNGLLSQDK